jgi:outer membrane lipoprotein-sorting protein
MKKFICFFLTALLITACGSNEQNARKLIKTQMKNIVTDYKSYKSISFGGIDSLFTTYQKDSTYVGLMRKAADYKSISSQQTQQAITAKTLKETEAIKKLVDAYADSANLLNDQASNYAKAFKNTFIGWQMSHTFSATNAQGTNEIMTYKFYFDKPLNNLVGWEKE